MDYDSIGNEYSGISNSTTKDKAIALYSYLRELSALKILEKVQVQKQIL